jgi:hypothetical protein
MDTRECSDKRLSHLLASKVPRRKSEHRYPGSYQRGTFNGTVPHTVILGEHNPPSLPNLGKPIFVFCIYGEMILVDFHSHALLT